jgi:hypothetical protein
MRGASCAATLRVDWQQHVPRWRPASLRRTTRYRRRNVFNTMMSRHKHAQTVAQQVCIVTDKSLTDDEFALTRMLLQHEEHQQQTVQDTQQGPSTRIATPSYLQSQSNGLCQQYDTRAPSALCIRRAQAAVDQQGWQCSAMIAAAIPLHGVQP